MSQITTTLRRIATMIFVICTSLSPLLAQNLNCTPVFGTNTTNVLSTITINGVTNTTTSTSSYENFPSLNLGSVNAGSNVVINAQGILASYNNISLVAFMDFNNDGVIDNTTERLILYSRPATSPTNYSTGNTNLTIPASVSSGSYKLRIIAFCSTSGVNSCNNVPGGIKGQAEDYYITVNGQTCTAPTATYTTVPNCGNNTYNVSVSISSLGNASNVQIKNGSTTLQTVSSAGTYSVGPFTSGTSVNLSVANAANSNCTSTAQSLSYTCPCTEPTATYVIIPDCDNNQYRIAATISNLGTATNVGILINGNTYQTTTSTGTYNIGPFQSGTSQSVNVANAANNACAGVAQTMTYTCPACVAPSASYEINDDCANQTYTVDVIVSNLGSGTEASISNNGVNLQTVNAPGTYTFGPFTNGTNSQFTITTSTNANCSTMSAVMSTACAPCTSASALYNIVEDCLYNEFSIQVALANLGTAQEIEIKHGAVTLATATATGNYTVGPFTNGEQVVLTLVDATNEFCTSTSATLLSTCPACVEATISASVIDNCDEQTFTISLDVTDLGSATSVAINNGTTLLESIDAVGNYIFGPYANGTIIALNGVNEQNIICTIDLGDLASSCTPCTLPTVLFSSTPSCDDNAFYINAEVTSMGSNETLTHTTLVIEEEGIYSFGPYTSGEEATITLQGNTSNACLIESEVLTFTCPTCEEPTINFTIVSTCDENTFSIEANITSMGNNSILTGENVTIEEEGTFTFGPYTSGEEVTITLVGDATNNCSITSETLSFTCPTCEAPVATFTTVENCDNEQFYVSIDLTSMGNNTSIEVESLVITEEGEYTVGPFASQETVYITLVGNTTNDCTLTSEALTFDCTTIEEPGEEPGTAVSTTDFNFELYPNPSTGVFTIESEVKGNILLLDAAGKIVATLNLEAGNNTISVQNLANGMYTVQIQTKYGNHFKRLSIQH